jgi:hypothetical protein
MYLMFDLSKNYLFRLLNISSSGSSSVNFDITRTMYNFVQHNKYAYFGATEELRVCILLVIK